MSGITSSLEARDAGPACCEAQLNIDHFRKMLTTEQDIKMRTMLVRLLAKEEAKLAALKRKSRSGEPARFHYRWITWPRAGS